jgi:hypothetical protein
MEHRVSVGSIADSGRMEMVMVTLPVTVSALEERLVAVHSLWRRTPGDGASPFARDIPALSLIHI